MEGVLIATSHENSTSANCLFFQIARIFLVQPDKQESLNLNLYPV